MKCIHLSLLVVGTLIGSALLSSPLNAADRLTDRDLKRLVARIHSGLDHFENALDSRLKHSLLPGPSGDGPAAIEVEHYLQDLKENVDKFEDRLTPASAAGTEAATVLRQASRVHAFVRQQSPTIRGESEWNRVATDFKTLALEYGTDFPLPDNAMVRRMNDGEVAAAAEAVARTAERLGQTLDDELKKDPGVRERTRKTIVDEAGLVEKSAKNLRERVKDDEPGSAELDRLLTQASRVRVLLGQHQVPASNAIYADLAAGLKVLAGAYRVAWPGGR